jgi:PAS domain S-box-containing protein
VARNLAGGYGLLALLCFALAGLFAFLSLRGRALGAALARVVDHVPDLIAYVDASQRCRFHNRAYERFLGRGPREICGRTVRELLGDPAFETLRPAIERALAGEEVSFEVRIEFPGIGPRDVSVSYVPDTDPFGALAGFVSFMRDVTPVKEAERRERQRMLELAHVARVNSLGQMATEIAHEVNQPLAAISAYCAACLNSLQTAPQEGARLREWLEAIRAETVRVSEVVRRLRALVQRGERAHRPVDLNDLVEGVTRMLLGEARAQGVALETSLTPGLPGVVGDQVLLEQVVLNLLLNALDSLAEAPPERRRITVGTRRADDGVSVAVADSGPGVPADLEERLFEPFFSTKAEGLGMGLVISRSIVEAHGGRLEHGSAPGGGAIFTFTLPAAHP